MGIFASGGTDRASRSEDRRMDLCVLACAAAGILAAAITLGPAWAAGFAFGALLSWLNLWLLRSGVDAMGRSARTGQIRRSRRALWPRWALGVALAGAGLYGIFVLHWAPWRAVLAGLFTAFAGVFLFAIAELLQPVTLPSPAAHPAPPDGADPETD